MEGTTNNQQHNNTVMDVSDQELKPLYQWVDAIPLSRPKRNIARDFADGGEWVGGSRF